MTDTQQQDWRDEQRAIRRDLADYARANRDAIDAEWSALPEAINSTEAARRHLAAMPRERREQLHREWSDPNFHIDTNGRN